MSKDLDFQIAELVIGECPHREHEYYYVQGDSGWSCKKCHKDEHCPKYSSEVSAAFLIVWHMQKFKIRGVFNMIGPCDDSDNYSVHFSKKWDAFMRGKNTRHEFDGIDKNPAMAICIAALKAVGDG